MPAVARPCGDSSGSGQLLSEPALCLLPGEELRPRPRAGDVPARRPPARPHRPVQVEAPRRLLVRELHPSISLSAFGQGVVSGLSGDASAGRQAKTTRRPSWAWRVK